MKKIYFSTLLSFSILSANYLELPTFTNYQDLKVLKSDLVDESLSIFKKYKKRDFYNLSFYTGILKYKNSLKDNGKFAGAYYSYYKYPFKMETNINFTFLNYKDDSKLKQKDFSLLEHYYFKTIHLKAGIHLIKSDDSLTDWGKVGILGISFYKYNNYSIGLDNYYSYYSNNSNSPKLIQFKGYVNKHFNFFNFGLGYNYIHFFNNYTENNLKQNYHYINSFLNFSLNKEISTTISAWKGDRVLAVNNNGFVVNNLLNVEKYGGFIKQNFIINNNSSLSLEYSFKRFIDNNKNANQNMFMLGYNLFW